MNGGVSEIINVEKDADGVVKATGFCIDVFEEVLKSLPYGDGLAIGYLFLKCEL